MTLKVNIRHWRLRRHLTANLYLYIYIEPKNWKHFQQATWLQVWIINQHLTIIKININILNVTWNLNQQVKCFLSLTSCSSHLSGWFGLVLAPDALVAMFWLLWWTRPGCPSSACITVATRSLWPSIPPAVALAAPDSPSAPSSIINMPRQPS